MDILLKIVTQGVEQARTALRGLGEAVRQQAQEVRAYNAAVRNGVAAWQQIAQLAGAFVGLQQLRQAVVTAQQYQVELAQLRRTLSATGQASEGLLRSLEDQAGELQALTGVGDDTVLAVQRLLFSFGATADQVRRLTPLVLDFAAATGQSATAAAQSLGAALAGRGAELRRYGIEASNLEELTQQLAARFAGQAAAAQAARGPMGELQVAIDQVRQELGRLLLVPLEPFLRALARQLEAARQSFAGLREASPAGTAALQAVGSAVAQLAALLTGPAAIVAGLAALQAILRLLAPGVQLLRVALFALAGGLIEASRQMGLATAVAAQFRTALDSTAAAAARARSALTLAGAGLSGLLAAWSGYELGKALGGIEVMGRTIQDRLVDVIFRAQGAWARFLHTLGLIDEAELQRRLDVVRQALEPEPPETPEQAEAEPRPAGPQPAPELERLRHTASWFAYLAKIAANEESRLVAMRGQLEFTREIVRLRERELEQAARAAEDAEGRVVQTREYLEAERAFMEAREQEVELTRQIAELEREIAEKRAAGERTALLRTFRGQLGLQLGREAGFVFDAAGQIDNLAAAARDAASVVTGTLGAAFRSISEQITGLILGTVSWGEALANIGRIVVTQLVASLVQFFVQLGVRAALTAIMGQTIAQAAAAGAAAAWSGPAVLASIATMGSAAAIGPTSVLGALATAPAITAAATVAGYEEGGLVPPGERIIRVNERGQEYVVNAEATRRWLPVLEAINQGRATPPPAAGAGPAAGPRSLSLVLVDSRNAAREWLLSAEGEARIIEILRRRKMEVGLR